jgi:hypothetical protein
MILVNVILNIYLFEPPDINSSKKAILFYGVLQKKSDPPTAYVFCSGVFVVKNIPDSKKIHPYPRYPALCPYY